MIDELTHQLLQKIEDVAALYYRLIILITEPALNQRISVNDLKKNLKCGTVNVSLDLSRLMISLTSRQRALKVSPLLDQIVKEQPYDIVLLNHNQILFEPNLRQDPLRLLQNLSRQKTIIVIWEGQVQGQYLTYAVPGHPEYRRYPTRELILINLDSATSK